MTRQEMQRSVLLTVTQGSSERPLHWLKEALSLSAYRDTWVGTRYSQHSGRDDHRQLRGQEGPTSSKESLWGSQQEGP